MSDEKTKAMRRELQDLRLENAHLKNEVRRAYHEIHGLRAQLEYQMFVRRIDGGGEEVSE